MPNALPKSQSGLALIFLLLIIVLGGLGWFLATLNRTQYHLAQQTQTALALAEAKEALLGFAATYFDQLDSSGNPLAGYYGFLPCPDVRVSATPEGEQDGNCGGRENNSLGRLPWRTLGLPPLRDGSGACLWYAVAGPYKTSPRSFLLNEDRAGRFILRRADGGTTAVRALGRTSNDASNPRRTERPIALIIAPGKRLDTVAFLGADGRTQNRTLNANTPICDTDYDPALFLDVDAFLSANAILRELDNTIISGSLIDNAQLGSGGDENGVEAFVTSPPLDSSINDQVVVITQTELFEAVRKRSDFLPNLRCVTQIAAQCLANYGRDHLRLPWPAPIGLGDYRPDASYNDDSSLTGLGRLPNTLDTSNSMMGVVSPAFLLADGNHMACNLSSLDSSTLTACSSAVLDPTELNTCDGHNMTAACQDTGNTAVTAARRLWQQWKDRLFYAVSDPFLPSATPAALPTCTGNCLTVNGIEQAAIVIFAGQATLDQHRNMTPDADTRDHISNYLDSDNADGDTAYTHTHSLNAADDFIMCIGTDLTAASVVPCP